MKKDRIVASLIVLMGWVCCSLFFGSGVMAQEAAPNAVGVAYRGHVQDYGDQPAGEAWVAGAEQLGTTGEGKRIEGFRIKLTGTENLPAGAGIRYNVHVQNVGWLASTDLAQTETWVANGNFAGSQSKSQRVEAIQIVLTGADGKALPGYSVQYQVHGQDYGWAQGWKADGAIAGSVGESRRLEAIQIKIVKTATEPVEDEPVVYDKAGTNGPATGTQTIAGDVTVAADGVILKNLVIEGDLTISEAVGDGTVTLNNVTVAGDTFVRGGGKNSIHINGGSYKTITVENTPTGQVRIVATDADGLDVVIAEDAAGEIVILEGVFDSVAVNAPNMTVTTQGDTTIARMAVSEAGVGSTLNLGAQTTVDGLELDAKTSVTGQGTVKEADVKSDGVSFEKAPVQQTVAPEVTVPPVIVPVVPPVVPPSPGGGGGYTPPSKIALTISDPTVTLSRIYDGTRNAAVTTTGTLTGVETGDDVQVTATASYDSKAAGTGKTITVTYALTGTAAGNYTKPVDDVLTIGVITAKPLTIADPTLTTSKAYDGDVTAAVTAGNLIGVVGSEAVTPKATASYNNAAVAENKSMTVVYTLDGDDKANYTAPANFTATIGKITKKQLTITLNSVTTDKVYNGTYSATANCGALEGTVDNDMVGVVMNAVYDSKNVGNNKTITISYSINGDDAVVANYLAPITVERHDGKITPIQLTAANAVVTTTKDYDGDKTAFITDNGTISGILADDSGVQVTPVANYSDKTAVNPKTIQVSFNKTGDDAGNYTVPAAYDYSTPGVINKKTLGVNNDASIETTRKEISGDTTATVHAAPTIDQTGIIGADTVDISLTDCHANFIDSSPPYQAIATPGAYNIRLTYTLSGTDAVNYTATGYADTPGEIFAEGTVIWYPSNTDWKTYNAMTTQNLPFGYTIFAVNGTTFYATNNAGTVEKSTNNGANWTIDATLNYNSLPTGYTIFDVYVDNTSSPATTTLWAVNTTNNSYQYYNGTTWVDSGWTNALSALPTAGAIKYYKASDGSSADHLIVYDSATRTATDYNCSPGGQSSQEPLPALPTGFTHSFLRYTSSTLALYAY